MCCAWIAQGLRNAGYRAGSEQTAKLVERLSNAPADAFLGSKSVEYLMSSGQLSDLDFILGHIDDVAAVFALKNNEITRVPACV
jgi:phosphosulfolactate phosphohydrolase-like enzyme